MRCATHKKETIGPCNWCGQKLCQGCIAAKNGKKYYCGKCSTMLQVPKGIQQEEAPAVQFKKPVIKNGYLDFEQ